MDVIKQKAQSIVDKYEQELTANGIKITVSKRYFETAVGQRTASGGSEIFNTIDRALDRKREEKRGYNYTNNKYHSIVLRVIPCEKGVVSKEFCKEYSLMLRKVERAHIGLEPKKTAYEENEILAKIEKRILKILEKAQKTTPQEVCRDKFFDTFRYITPNYLYKERILGKDREIWETIFAISGGILTIAVIVIVAWITESF